MGISIGQFPFQANGKMGLSHSDKMDIENEGFKALQEYIASCTVVIMSKNVKVKHGSGVPVKYDNQDYILTATHVLKEEQDNDNILVIGRSGKPLIDVPKDRLTDAIFNGSYGRPEFTTPAQISITGRIYGKSDEDIAALKVQNATERLPNTIFHNLTDQGETEIKIGEIVNIFGFPGELGQPVKSRVTGQCGWAVFPHLERREIRPNSDTPHDLDPRVYLITDFTFDRKTCDPRGMSGCGIWSIPKLREGRFWSPNESQLLGIQSAFNRERQLLAAVRIERILGLLV